MEWRRFGIKNGDIVADFGGGGRPLIRADIIVDKFISGMAERPNQFLDNGAYIIQCDLAQLPFKNKSIDFIYSSNVVEHLENLEQSLKEMERTGKKGVIICPSAMREKIIPLHMHLWYLEEKNDSLVITKKPKPYEEFIGNYIEKLMTSEKAYVVYKFQNSLMKDCFLEHCWENKINYKISQTGKEEKWKIEGESEFQEAHMPAMSARKLLLNASSAIVRWFSSKKFDIRPMLCCPYCKGDLSWKKDYALCYKCRIAFPYIEKRIFCFLEGKRFSK